MIKYNNNTVQKLAMDSAINKMYYGGDLVFVGGKEQFKYKATYTDSSSYTLQCNGDSSLRIAEYRSGNTTNSQRWTAATQVEIGDCVTRIEDGAVLGYQNLTGVTLPNTLTYIGNGGIFADCSGLTEVNIPSGVTYLGSDLFNNCVNLRKADLPSGLQTLGCVFYNCQSLSSCTIPSGVTSLSGNTFYQCYSLSSITIPSGVTAIYGSNPAFNKCSGLTEVHFQGTTPPQNIVFNACPNIEKIYIPSCDCYNAYASVLTAYTDIIYAEDEAKCKPKVPTAYTEVEYIYNSQGEANPTGLTNMLHVTLSSIDSGNVYTFIYKECDKASGKPNGDRTMVGAIGGQLEIRHKFTTGIPRTYVTCHKYETENDDGYNTDINVKYQYVVSTASTVVTNLSTSNSYTWNMQNNYVTPSEYNLGIFNSYNLPNGLTYYNDIGYFYYLKVEDSNGNLLNEFVPVIKKSNNKIGIYDTVTDTFYYDASAILVLTAGPSV